MCLNSTEYVHTKLLAQARGGDNFEPEWIHMVFAHSNRPNGEF